MAGLPKVQLAKKAAMAEGNSEHIPANAPVVLSMVPTIPLASEAATPEVVSESLDTSDAAPEVDLRAENEALSQRYRSLQGVIAKLEPKARAFEERSSQLEEELRQLQAAIHNPPIVDTSDDLTEEEINTYGPQSQAYIEKLTRKQYKQYEKRLNALIEDRFNELKNGQQKLGRELAMTAEEQFLATVKANVRNFDSIVTSQKWFDYVATRIPYTQGNIGDALKAAVANGDLERTLEIFNGFKPAASGLQSMASPAVNSGASPITTRDQKPMLKMSDRVQLSKDFRLGRLDANPDKARAILQARTAEFAQAEKEGRLDYNS